MSIHCDEYRDWSDSYRLQFVKYNRTLRLSVIRKCGVRLGIVLHSLDRIGVFTIQTQMCLLLMSRYPQFKFKVIKVKSVVSEAPSAEASLSYFLYVTPGNRFEQLASMLLSKFQELSDRGLPPPPPQYRVSQFWLVVVSLV